MNRNNINPYSDDLRDLADAGRSVVLEPKHLRQLAQILDDCEVVGRQGLEHLEAAATFYRRNLRNAGILLVLWVGMLAWTVLSGLGWV